MKDKRLFWGIVVLAIGIVALLSNWGVIHFSWTAALKLWPLLIVILGIMLLPTNDIVKAILLVVTIGIGCLLYHYQAQRHNSVFDWFSVTDTRCSTTGNDIHRNAACSAWGGLVCRKAARTSPCTGADTRLEVQMGTGKLSVCGLCDELATATQGGKKLEIASTKSNGVTILSLSTLSSKTQAMRGIGKPINIMLNDTPTWDMDISAGASDIDIDLSRHSTERLDIAATTGNINVKMGEYDIDSNISITAGLSKISITIPKNANCTIECPSALAHKDFADFTETSKNHWQSDGDGAASHNIRIKIDAAAAYITVKRA